MHLRDFTFGYANHWKHKFSVGECACAVSVAVEAIATILNTTNNRKLGGFNQILFAELDECGVLDFPKDDDASPWVNIHCVISECYGGGCGWEHSIYIDYRSNAHIIIRYSVTFDYVLESSFLAST